MRTDQTIVSRTRLLDRLERVAQVCVPFGLSAYVLAVFAATFGG